MVESHLLVQPTKNHNGGDGGYTKHLLGKKFFNSSNSLQMYMTKNPLLARDADADPGKNHMVGLPRFLGGRS